jgi:patatin-like phospholipase/acyl hydrolase
MESKKYYKILSLDGGGIRGLLTCKMLQELEDCCPGFLDKIDLFAGTSTGGILALGLAAGFSPEEMANIYLKKGSLIFSKGFWDRLGDVDRFFDSDYDNRSLRAALEDQFEKNNLFQLGDLKKNVLISSFCLDNDCPARPPKQKKDSTFVRSWKPKFFHNFETEDENNNDRDERILDVAMHTSAAPTFFPLHEGFADGGLVANNPSMCALAQAVDRNTGRQKLEDVVLLSVGTGATPKFLTGMNDRWGYIKWAPNLISIMMDGVSGVADFQCAKILDERYRRVNIKFDKEIGLDDVSDRTLRYLSGEDVPATDREPELKSWKRQIDLEKQKLEFWINSYFLDKRPEIKEDA